VPKILSLTLIIFSFSVAMLVSSLIARYCGTISTKFGVFFIDFVQVLNFKLQEKGAMGDPR